MFVLKLSGIQKYCNDGIKQYYPLCLCLSFIENYLLNIFNDIQKGKDDLHSK